MSTLDEVKPTVKQRVIDLVSAAGIDVSDWGILPPSARIITVRHTMVRGETKSVGRY